MVKWRGKSACRGLFAFAVAFAGAVPGEPSDPAELIAFQGRTEIRESGGEDWQPAQLKQSLPARSTVRTGEASWASILFLDQTQIKLSSNALFQIKEVASSGNGQTLVEMRRGRAWTQSKTPPARFIMQTPAVNAGIEGTDWVVDVDADGTTLISVLSGEVRCFNDRGEVRAGRNEEVLTVPGGAPSKRPLANPRQRVQWVGSRPVQWQRYPSVSSDPRYRGLVRAVQAGRNDEALVWLAAQPTEHRTATLSLLRADILLSAGDLPAAEEELNAGLQAYPDDPRMPAAVAATLLLADREDEAQRLVAQGLERFPDAAELWLAEGDLARWSGERERAQASYARAADLAPEDPRPHLGSGRIASEREDFPTGRRELLAALERSPDWAEALGELGWLETLADDLGTARERLEQALAQDPTDYVALTGLGYLALKQGDPAAALRHLLAANSIEPRYARAVQVMGIAFYQQDRLHAALDSLQRAAELDPRDPMPWFLISLIRQDQWQPGAAVAAAEQGLDRLPYLKSMNQLAVDLQGSANLGSAYALFGLEDWAMRTAQDSYDPFWAGSHLFLANRYAGEFSRNAELTLGFLTDPTAFGTGGRRQPLLSVPAWHGSATYWRDQSKDSRVQVPTLRLNGYQNTGMPLGWLLEGQYQRWDDKDLDTEAGQFTLGLGVKPVAPLRLFLYASRFEPEVSRDLTGGEQRIDGASQRIDAGVSLRHGPDSQSWFKAGHSDESSTVDGPDLLIPSTRERSELSPRRDDLQFRHTRRLGDDWQLSLGLEWARRRDDADYRLWSQPGAGPSSSGQDRSRDQSTLAYAALKLGAFPELDLEAGLSYTRLESETRYTARIGDIDLDRGDYRKTSKRLHPSLGAVYRLAPEWTLRAALQDWTRPVSFNTLAPVATAGIPVDDLFTLPGGRLERGKLQLEWRHASSLTSAWMDRRKIRNLSFDPLAGPDNGTSELADLSRLAPPSLLSLALDVPEGLPRFASGELREWGLSYERVLRRELSMRLRYRGVESENTRWFSGNKLPFVPRHHATFGASWFPWPGWAFQARADYRSRRYADAANSEPLDAGWDATLMASRQSARKDWQADLYLRSLGNPELPVSAGLALSYRF